MTLTLSFPPELEMKLRERAAATGKDLATVVREALEEKLISPNSSGAADKTPQQWEAEFAAWIASHKAVAHHVDDSRESIYADRGK